MAPKNGEIFIYVIIGYDAIGISLQGMAHHQ